MAGPCGGLGWDLQPRLGYCSEDNQNGILIIIVQMKMFIFVMTQFFILSLFCFGASADRCIQNIYRQLRQETGTPKKYPGVLASLLMLDKLSIEDIKASVTELMAGGVDTVRKKTMMTKINAFQD